MRLKLNALKRSTVGMLAVLLVVSTPMSVSATDDKGQSFDPLGKPDIILHGEAYAGWDLSTSGRVAVDGRFVTAFDRIQNGSRITVDKLSSAKAEIKGVGRVSILPRSEIVLDLIDETVVARMVHGKIRVETSAKIGAYVETPDSVVVSHPGSYASFRVIADPLGTTLERGFGDVELLAAANADDDLELDDTDDSDYIHIKARSSETLKVKLKKNGSEISNQPVTFAITQAIDGATGGFDEGVQRITTSTNSDGEAEVEFVAGAASGQVIIEAFIPGTDAHETLHVFIHAKEKKFWNTKTTALYMALGAGAIAGAILAIENARGDEGDRGPEPPVVVVP